MAEEAKNEGVTIPAAINRVRIAVFAIYFTLPAVALSALPGHAERGRRVPDPARPDRGAGRLRRRPGAGRGQADGPRAVPARRRDLRRPAGRHDPVPGHQRGHHRRLAARLLDGHPPPDARLAAPPAPALPHAVDRHPRLLGRRDRPHASGPGGPAGPGLLVRRAAVVHDGPRRRRPPARQAPGRAAALPRARQHQDRQLRRAAVRARRRHRSPRSRSSSSSRSTCRWPRSATAWLLVGIVVYTVYRRRQGLDLPSTHKVAIPQPVIEHEAEYDSVLVCFGDDGYDAQVVATAAKLAARKRRGIHVLVTINVPYSLPIGAPMKQEAGDRAQPDRAGQGPGRRARLRARRARAAGPGRAPDHRGGAGHARGRGRDAAAAARQGRLGVRQDARDRARRAALPRDHRVLAGRLARRPTRSRRPGRWRDDAGGDPHPVGR